ncbi:uncharacterized protein LOC117344449 isoform X3 [Pecten maximus]|uniref:uncharacterized protein LOC117344449 isoform X3 n=1 Tax=Pecten maximus TaxID=6579 RepID=UPI00145896C4|nr:uncharacterized protein LOC117344449 isoform X3 [Pecten maximus]
MYYVAVSNNSDANNTDCKLYIEGGKATEVVKLQLFTEYNVTNLGKNSFTKIQPLNLTQGESYFLFVMATDKSGQCAMTVKEFTTDTTPPTMGRMTAGMFYDMPVSYTADNKSVTVYWEGFADPESSITSYSLSLYKYASCRVSDNTEILVMDWIILSSNNSEFTLVDLELKPSIPYLVKLKVTNGAGLYVTVTSSPILYDKSFATEGRVSDGLDFQNDGVWFNKKTSMTGSFLHLASPTAENCPQRPVSVANTTGWYKMEQNGFKDPTCKEWNLVQKPGFVIKDIYDDIVTLKVARDSNEEKVNAGIYYRSADMENGGDYQVMLKAAGGGGKAVTEIMFWDGPINEIATLDYYEDPDWTEGLCSCCLIDPPPADCSCDCPYYLQQNNLTAVPSASVTTTTLAPTTTVTTTTSPYDVISDDTAVDGVTAIDTSCPPTQRSCGVQIHTADPAEGFNNQLVVWCRNFNNTEKPSKAAVDLNFNPSTSYHAYQVSFVAINEEAVQTQWCMRVFVDSEYMAELCGIAELTLNTLLVFHVFNKNNVVPPIVSTFDPWSAKAYINELIMPPAPGSLCRYGVPFRGATDPILRYEAGIGTTKLGTEAEPFRLIDTPCIPCFDDCSRFQCDTACNPDVRTLKTFTLANLTLEPKLYVENETGHGLLEDVTYYLTVRAMVGSGETAVSSSNGFYIDDTPPAFDTDVFIYIDVNQGEFTPTYFQSSNSTIKAIWLCEDSESLIKDYQWSIGTTVGAQDLQDWESVGVNPTGINATFEGLLEHNTTYYVSVKCTSGAGDVVTYNDTKGTTVLLEPPVINDVNTDIVGTEPFPQPVIPANSKILNDSTTLTCSFTMTADESVDRYDFCVGSTAEEDDIFPCTYSAINVSTKVEIKNGNFYINGMEIRALAQLRAPKIGESAADQSNSANSKFELEPMRQAVMYLRICNKAVLCTNKTVATTVISSSGMMSSTSSNGSSVTILFTLGSSRRRKRATNNINIQTPEGLLPGQTIVVTPLDDATVQKDYRSDASLNFVPYIVNPSTTSDLTERLLQKRFLGYSDTFAIGSLGHYELPGPLLVTYPDTVGNVTTGNRTMLLHWNKKQTQWEISSESCEYETDREVFNGDGTVTVKVCETHKEAIENVTDTVPDSSSRRRRRAAVNLDSYFSSETQFVLATTAAEPFNSPPIFESDPNIFMLEDEGIIQYQLVSSDLENDTVEFYLETPSENNTMGTVLLSLNGLLYYTPCTDCNGLDYIYITLAELQSDPDIPPENTSVILTVNITEINDPPVIFASQFGDSVLNEDITEPIVLYLEQKNSWNTDKWETTDSVLIIGAYDVEMEHLSLSYTEPAVGTILSSTQYTDVPEVGLCPTNRQDRTATMFPCGNFSSEIPHDPINMSWLYFSLNFSQPDGFTGLVFSKFYFNDTANKTSDVITVQFTVLESPCHNSGYCHPKNASNYPCQNVYRASSFDLYYDCICQPGYTGVYCEEDIDECASSPCPAPFICQELVNQYQCICPEGDLSCVFEAWMIALIVLACILLIILLLLCLYIRKVKKSGHFAWVEKYILCREKQGSMASLKTESDTSDESSEMQVFNKNPDREEADGDSGKLLPIICEEEKKPPLDTVFVEPPEYTPTYSLDHFEPVPDSFEYVPPTRQIEQPFVPNTPPVRPRINPTHEYQTLPRYTHSNFKPLPILKGTKTSSMAMGGAGYQIKSGGQVVKPPPPYSMDDFMQKMKENAKRKKKKVTRKRRKMKPKTAPLDDNVDVYMGHVRQTPLPSKIHTPIDFEMSRIPSESPPPYASPQPKGSNSGSSRSPGDGESIENVSQGSQSPPTAISFLAAKPLQDFPPVLHPREAFVKTPTFNSSGPTSSQRGSSLGNHRRTASPVSLNQPRANLGRAPSPFLHMRDGPENQPIDIDVDTDSMLGVEEIDNPAFEGDGGNRAKSNSPTQSQPLFEEKDN